MKKDIIRPGDRVRVISPYRFVRCGYPLTVEMVKEELLAPENAEKMKTLANAVHDLGGRRCPRPWYSNEIHDKLLTELAYDILKARRFGGPERSIHTEVRHDLLFMSSHVSEVKSVRTGSYCRGYGSSWDDEGEGPSLYDGKNHRIVRIGWNSRYLHSDELWFEASRLEKLSD